MNVLSGTDGGSSVPRSVGDDASLVTGSVEAALDATAEVKQPPPTHPIAEPGDAPIMLWPAVNVGQGRFDDETGLSEQVS